MLKKLFCVALLGLLAALGTAAEPAQPARVAGTIIAARVRGSVTAKNNLTGTSQELHDRDLLGEKYTVTTGGSSSVVLLFSNGATVEVGPDSALNIDEFQQDPFGEDVKTSELTSEPTTSKTKLDLVRGELVGKVAHLNMDRGSEFTVHTPVGAAGIRGTTFRIVYHVSSDGRVFFSISTAEGRVLFQGSTREVSVPGGKEVTVTATVNITGGGANSAPVVTVEDISPADAAAIQAVVQEILSAISDTGHTFGQGGDHRGPNVVPAPPQTTNGGGSSGS